MSAGIFGKDALFNDGEGIAHEDFNNLQRFLHSLIADGLVSHFARLSDAETAGMSTSHLFAMGNSGAVFAGLSNRQSLTKRGVIFQRVSASSPTGNDTDVLAYYMSEGEGDRIHDTAAANPRWDVLSVGLARVDADSQSRDFKDAITGLITAQSLNKQRRVTATFTLTKGVENASPVEPSIPGGHVKLAAFRVSPAMTTFNPTTDIRDYRMPVGPISVVDIPGTGYAIQSGGSEATSNAGILTLPSTRTARAICQVSGGSKRLVRVGFAQDLVAVTALNLQRGNVATSFTTLRNLIALAGGGGSSYQEFDILGAHGEPLWSNGYAAGYANESLTVSPTAGPTRLALMATGGAASSAISVARFVFVG